MQGNTTDLKTGVLGAGRPRGKLRCCFDTLCISGLFQGTKQIKILPLWRLYSSQEGNTGREKAVTNEQINI